MCQILGRPSAELADRIAKDDKERMEEQRKSLGSDGLTKKKEELESAIKQNEVKLERSKNS